ncbi:hypothetical protein [Actinacidiphila sp. bgisy160]|uniref:hypothetical protein n=1 Tax=Actinacidiphila sp. bgisy160 TaxID=3413796 RepID=UPI003D748506
MTATPDPADLIDRFAMGQQEGHPYPGELPADIAPWHCYLLDGGHSLLVALGSLYAAGVDPGAFMVPAPVKTVLRAGYTFRDGYPVADLPYDPTLGLVTDPGDDEFDGGPEPAAALHRLAVGEPYNARITQWPGGMGQLRLTLSGAEFVLPIDAPARHEVKAFGQGTAEFGIVSFDRFAMLLYRFTDPRDSNPKHGLPWSDAAWEYHRQAIAEPVELPAAAVFPLRLVLVDAVNGVVQALRAVTPPQEFCDALRTAAARQQGVQRDDARAGQEIRALYARHSSVDLLLQAEARFEALRD